MTWDDMRAKLVGLVGAGGEADALFEDLRQFGSGSQKGLRAIERLAGESRPAGRSPSAKSH